MDTQSLPLDTCNQPCWLAKAVEVILLLLVLLLMLMASGAFYCQVVTNMHMVQVYYAPRQPVYCQATLPTIFGGFRLLRVILIREAITLVHAHQAFSVMGHEAILQARTMGYKVGHARLLLNTLCIVIIITIISQQLQLHSSDATGIASATAYTKFYIVLTYI